MSKLVSIIDPSTKPSSKDGRLKPCALMRWPSAPKMKTKSTSMGLPALE
jgi:hypothetical protein